MNATPSLRVLRQRLHLSYSQVSTYLGCSLKYFLQYVQGLVPEHCSSALLLGSAVHAAAARYYQTVKENGGPAEPGSILELFRDALSTEIAHTDTPVLFKSDAPDADALLAQGEGLLHAFLADPGFTGMEVVAVELPLSTRLVDADGSPTDFELVGAVDLLLRDELGRYLAVDLKTAKQPYTQDGVDKDLQLSAYALLLAENGYLEPGQSLLCGFNVLRKLKMPKVERFLTQRTVAERQSFARLANAVLGAIEAQTYLPSYGWQCTDCPYKSACRQW